VDLREKAARHNIDKTVGRNIRRFRIARGIEALGRRLDVPALWICEQAEELANSLMR